MKKLLKNKILIILVILLIGGLSLIFVKKTYANNVPQWVTDKQFFNDTKKLIKITDKIIQNHKVGEKDTATENDLKFLNDYIIQYNEDYGEFKGYSKNEKYLIKNCNSLVKLYYEQGNGIIPKKRDLYKILKSNIEGTVAYKFN